MADSPPPSLPFPTSDDNAVSEEEPSAGMQSSSEGSLHQDARRKISFADGKDMRTSSPASRTAAPSPISGDGASLQDQLLNALENGELETFEELAAHVKVNLNHKYGPPLHKHYGNILEIACRRHGRGEFVRVLLKHMKPNIREVNPEPIHYAAHRGHDDSLNVLLSDKRTKVYALNSKGQTALHLACTHFTPNRADEYGKCIELLIPKMSIADINKPDSNGFTAFHTLVRGRDKKIPTKTRSTSVKVGGEKEEEKSPEACEDKKSHEASAIDEAKAREELVHLFLRLTQGALDVDSDRAKGRTAREDVEMRFPHLRELLPERRSAAPRADPYLSLLNALQNDNIDLFSALLQETDPDGNPTLDPNHVFSYPLHTSCLEMACQRNGGETFVRVLLEAGADPNVPNKFSEKYPIHLACERGHYKDLQALLDYSKVQVDVNCEDKFGNTPLHCTVDRISDDKRRELGRRKCLEILLKLEKPQEVDVSRINAAGYTAFLMLVEDGNKAAIQTFMKIKWNLDFKSLNTRGLNDKPLRVLITQSFPQLKTFLDRPGSADTQRLRRDKSKKFFELLNPLREEDFVKHIRQPGIRDLANHNDKKFTMLQRAARYGLDKAVRALLEANVDPNGTFSGNLSPPGVIASCYRHKKVLEILLEYPAFKINATDSKGNSALHYAAKIEDNLETVILLLHNGADMSIKNNAGKTPFGKEQVQSLLDQCVKTNGKNALDEDYELIFDYRLIAPGPNPENVLYNCKYVQVNCGDVNGVTRIESCRSKSEKLGSEMDLLNMMSKNPELSPLLEHPVVLSFLQFKWIRLRYLSYGNLTVFILFLIFLNTYIILVTRLAVKRLNENRFPKPISIYEDEWAIGIGSITLLFWILLAIRELSQCVLDPRKYIKSLENYLDWAVLLSSLLSLLLPLCHEAREGDVLKIINTVTILLSCIALLLLLGRVSKFAKYIEMLKVVIKNYILPLLSYSIILVAFGLSFHSLCYESEMAKKMEKKEKAKIAQLCNITNTTGTWNMNKNDDEAPDFSKWYTSIVMTIVMMIGELDFKSIPNSSPQSIIVFILFVLLVTVVILNLLTGLAVSDTAKIEAAAKQLRLQSRVGVVLRSERTLVNIYNSDCMALRFLPMMGSQRGHMRRSLLFPWKGLENRESRVKTNLAGEVTLGGEDGQGGDGESLRMDREVERAKQIISRRGADPASRGLTLADVDARVQEVLNLLKMLEVRCGLQARDSDREARHSLVSVFSEPED